MKSIQQLHEAAAQETAKADDLRNDADKHRQKAQDNADNPQIMMDENNQAQKSEEKASVHDQAAATFNKEATDLEAKAMEISHQKDAIQASSQAQIEKLEQEEKMLRGETRGMI
jgi:hypothetical protein